MRKQKIKRLVVLLVLLVALVVALGVLAMMGWMVYVCWIVAVISAVSAATAVYSLLRLRRKTPGAAARWVYDFTVCYGVTELIHSLAEVNRCGYLLLNITESDEGYYTLFFRRPEVLCRDG